jgi:hypothetical protein
MESLPQSHPKLKHKTLIHTRNAVCKSKSHVMFLKQENSLLCMITYDIWSTQSELKWTTIPGATRFFREVVGLELGQHGLVSTTEELPDRKVAAPV